MSRREARRVEVYADWSGLDGPLPMGTLTAAPGRGKEVFSFEYDATWLRGSDRPVLDPELGLYSGPQFPPSDKGRFGVFLDSAPDRWGRLLLKRREKQLAREESRPARILYESDYLLGVYDGHRMGALRFRSTPDGPFLDDNHEFASPPWTSLRELEFAAARVERDDFGDAPDDAKWIRMLIAPGGSLGGARPKASVRDERNGLWIAKFPSQRDAGIDVGAWEGVVHTLAQRAGVMTAAARVHRFFGQNHTFLSHRFDRTPDGQRLHFASAMTLLQRQDGDDASTGVSYLDLAEFLVQHGAHTSRDLEELWRRIVFYCCVSNADDHLRNHGFLLTAHGWVLSPAYDMNPDPDAYGLKLNITDSENALDLELAKQVAPYFRVRATRCDTILSEVLDAVRTWRDVATSAHIARGQIEQMEDAFRVAEAS